MKFYIQSPDPFDLARNNEFLNWFPVNGERNKDWTFGIDKNKMGGGLCATFIDKEMASLFVLTFPDWIIPEPPDVDPEVNSYSEDNWGGRGAPKGFPPPTRD